MSPAAVTGPNLPFMLLLSLDILGTDKTRLNSRDFYPGFTFASHIIISHNRNNLSSVYANAIFFLKSTNMFLSDCFFPVSSVLKRLIAATDRVCDQGDGMVSPIYVAVNRHQSGSVRALLSEGYSPDAQDCTHVLGLRSPLSLALAHTSDVPYRL